MTTSASKKVVEELIPNSMFKSCDSSVSSLKVQQIFLAYFFFSKPHIGCTAINIQMLYYYVIIITKILKKILQNLNIFLYIPTIINIFSTYK